MEFQKIKVKVDGIADIMFDRFIDHSKMDIPPEQKLYLSGDNQVVFPSENIYAFLFGEDPQGCAKTFEGKKSSLDRGLQSLEINGRFEEHDTCEHHEVGWIFELQHRVVDTR